MVRTFLPPGPGGPAGLGWTSPGKPGVTGSPTRAPLGARASSASAPGGRAPLRLGEGGEAEGAGGRTIHPRRWGGRGASRATKGGAGLGRRRLRTPRREGGSAMKRVRAKGRTRGNAVGVRCTKPVRHGNRAHFDDGTFTLEATSQNKLLSDCLAVPFTSLSSSP